MTGLTLRPGIADAPIYVPGTHSTGDGDTLPAILSANENPLGPSPKAMEAYRAAAGELHRYPDGGSVALRDAIADWSGLDAARIVCGAGSDELLTMLARCYAGPGDEVLHSAHGFLMYSITAKTVGATPVAAPERDLHTDVDALLARVSERTKIVFLANPNNPTGTYIGRDEVRRLHRGLRDDILLVLDAAYAEFVDDPDYTDGADLVAEAENVVMTRTFSKVFGLPSLRLGWAFAAQGIVDALNRVRSPFNVNSAAQAAGVAALADRDYLERSLSINAEQRARLTGALQQLGLGVPPSVTNFVLARFADTDTANAANAALLEKGVIVRAMGGYGLPDSLRITVGTAEENDRLLAALGDFMNG